MVEIADNWSYERESFTAYEPELDEKIECVWKSVEAFGPEAEDSETLSPKGLLSDL